VNDVRYVRNRVALSRSFGDEVLLAMRDRPDVDQLSGTAAEVWRVLGVPSSMSELTSTLADRYGAPRDVIERDVASLLADLTERGLLIQVGDADD